MKALIRAYQLGISPFLGSSCRFVPTCSEYAIEAYSTHTFVRATLLTTRRLCRCNPWGPSGLDPVPSARRISPSNPTTP